VEDILTVAKAGEYCRVSPKTIINWVESGHIEAYKTVGGHRRIKKNNLETLKKMIGQARTKIEIAKSLLEISKANEKRIAANLSDTSIDSPVNGTVIEKFVELGEHVDDHQLEFTDELLKLKKVIVANNASELRVALDEVMKRKVCSTQEKNEIEIDRFIRNFYAAFRCICIRRRKHTGYRRHGMGYRGNGTCYDDDPGRACPFLWRHVAL